MPSYLELVGQPPRPDKRTFLHWCDDLIELRRQECDFRRTGPVAYLKAGGGGTQDGSSDANAFATLAQAQTWLAGLSAPDVQAGPTLLVKRGDVLRLTTGLVLPCDRVRIGAYGDPTLAKPVLSYGSIRIDRGNANWVETNAGSDAKNAWYIPWASVDANPGSYAAPGWIWDRNDPFNPYRYVGGVAACEDAPRSFHWDAANSRLYVNPGYAVEAWRAGSLVSASKIAADAIDFDVTGDTGSDGASFPSCIQNPEVAGGGRSGVLIENLVFMGWGCSALHWSNNFGVKISAGGNAATYVRDCEDYYCGRHAMSLEVGGSASGGRALFERCRAGYCSEATNGSTLFNAYSPGGGWECIHVDCDAAFGPLPDALPGGYGGKPFAWGHGECLPYAAFFGHSSGGNQAGLYLNVRGRISDNRGAYPYATACYFRGQFTDADMPGAIDDPLSWRSYFVGYRTHESRPSRTGTNLPETANVSIRLPSKAWLVNSVVHLWKHWSAGQNLFLSRPNVCAMLNTWLHLHDATTATGRLLHANNNTEARVWWFGGGATLDGQASGSTKVALAGRYSGKYRFANLLLVSPHKPLCLQSTTTLAGGEEVAVNAPSHIRHIAAYGAIDANTGTPTSNGAAGFDQAPGFVDLDALASGRPIAATERFSKHSPLHRAGTSKPFADAPFGAAEYDADGRPRSAPPAIGLYDQTGGESAHGAAGPIRPIVFELVA
jgi:hypothetical protein